MFKSVWTEKRVDKERKRMNYDDGELVCYSEDNLLCIQVQWLKYVAHIHTLNPIYSDHKHEYYQPKTLD